MKLFLLSLFACLTANAATWYASPTGTDGAAGTLADPISLHKALGDVSETSPASAGDTIWVRGGTYTPTTHVDGYYFRSDCIGTSGNRITVRAYQNELPIIEATRTNSTPLVVNGPYTTFWGFEFRNVATERTVTSQREPGVNVMAVGTRIINCFIHDTGDGIYCGVLGTGSEFGGNIIYNWGYDLSPSDRGHGHAIYWKSSAGGVIARDNIALFGFSNGIHPYSEDPDTLADIQVIGNVCAKADVLTSSGVTASEFLLGGAGASLTNFTAAYNFGYRTDSANAVVKVGYSTQENGDGIVRSNYWAGPAIVNHWTNLTFSQNTFPAQLSQDFQYNPSATPGTVIWDNNTYFSADGTPFALSGVAKSFATWKSDTGFDSSSTLTAAAKDTTTRVFVRANPYTTGRGHVIVYNWAGTDNVNVDLSSVLSVNQGYSIYDAQNPLGAAILTGTYAGGNVSFPMTNLVAATPEGLSKPTPCGPEFGAFLVKGGTINTQGTITRNVIARNLRINAATP